MSNKKLEWKFYFILKTFRPKKKFAADTIRYHLHKQAEASLSAGIDIREAVKKPEDEELNDWIAVHGMSANENVIV